MKRIEHLLYRLLLWLESKDSVRAERPPQICDYTEAQIHYHAGLLRDAGFATGNELDTLGQEFPEYRLGRLTWSGQEMLAAMRARLG